MKNFTNISEDKSKNLIAKPSKNTNKDFLSSIPMFNNFEINNKNYQYNIFNIINIENNNKLKTDANELKFNYYYEHYINIQPTKEQKKKKKNSVDYTSEIIKFKTELCHSWELTGACKYGVNVSLYKLFLTFFNQCVYAHGNDDLRNPLKEEKKYLYKTKLCKQFFCSGYCPYGARCQFCHKKPKISYIYLLKQIVKNKKFTRKFIKVPRLDVFKNITNLNQINRNIQL